jgi:hypothetical protein
MILSPERVHLSVQTGAPVLSNGCTCFPKYMHLFFIHFLVTVTVVTVVFIKIFHAYVCTYAGRFSLFFTVPSVTVPYLSSFARPPVPARLDLQSDRNEYKHF